MTCHPINRSAPLSLHQRELPPLPTIPPLQSLYSVSLTSWPKIQNKNSPSAFFHCSVLWWFHRSFATSAHPSSAEWVPVCVSSTTSVLHLGIICKGVELSICHLWSLNSHLHQLINFAIAFILLAQHAKHKAKASSLHFYLSIVSASFLLFFVFLTGSIAPSVSPLSKRAHIFQACVTNQSAQSVVNNHYQH